MAFLSLGLHNDEPPASSDQGKKDPARQNGKSLRARSPQPLGLASPANGSAHSANGNGHSQLNAPPLDEFEADKFVDELDPGDPVAQFPPHLFGADAMGKSVVPANGNGRTGANASSDNADNSLRASQPVSAKDIMPARALSDENARPAQASVDKPLGLSQVLANKNLGGAAAAPAKNFGNTPSLPPSVEQLRRRLAEEEKQRAARVGPGPLAASVDALSSSERQWVPTFSTFKFGYLPGKGLLFSTIGHEVVIFGLFLLVTYVIPTLRPEKMIEHQNSQDHVVVYLPELGGGSEGEKSPGAGESAPQEAAAAPARASKGFAYPGRQAILSNPPNPTNTFQTIQRPLQVKAETINKLLPAPNIVQMAETRLPSDLVAPKAVLPRLQETPKPIRVKQDSLTRRDAEFNVPVDAPKLLAKANMPKLPAAEQPLPQPPKVEPQPKQEEKRKVETPAPAPIKVATEKRTEKSQKEVAPPSAAQIARMEMHGKAKEPLLSLSPMAAPGLKVPEGEARGKFAIAPGGTLNPNSITPGKANGSPSTTPGTGQENANAPNAAGSEVASNSGNPNGKGTAGAGGPGHATVATGTGTSGTEGGTGNSAGAGTGGAGTGKGHGETGRGAGAAGGRQGNGSGAGAGSGSGTGSFPGITIQGGDDTQAQAKTKPSFTIEPQTSYNLTIVSTASSGGGLEDFGVFQNERIFTVYVPVKPSPELADPTWTMQYAIIKDSSVPDPGSQQVVPPSIASSEWPQLPPALEKKYSHHQVVIYAVVGKDGKVSGVSVKRTPDPRVSDPIANVLKKWIFHPAQVNNQPASVKILLGIPLT